ncbi:hypothetical protein C8J56DRAFT_800375 [Mycena floridula]|nr:hypothetical protein C8J56DRAFT_800375 [Mycena floridula]
MLNAEETLGGVDLPEWETLVEKWWLWEKAFGFEQAGHNKTKLAMKDRPSAVSWWISRGRKAIPKVTDAATFGKEWWDWWTEVNPGWCEKKETGLYECEGEGSWDVLMVSGINGFLSVLACLHWWFAAGRKSDALWSQVLVDVTWVLDCLLESQ